MKKLNPKIGDFVKVKQYNGNGAAGFEDSICLLLDKSTVDSYQTINDEFVSGSMPIYSDFIVKFLKYKDVYRFTNKEAIIKIYELNDTELKNVLIDMFSNGDDDAYKYAMSILESKILTT